MHSIHFIILLLGFSFALNTGILEACECKLSGNFETVAKQARLVALVKVTGVATAKNRYGRATALTAEILQVFQGAEDRKVITIWGSTGKDCRPLVTQFERNKTYKIALHAAGDDGFEKPGDYATSVCGEHWQHTLP